MRAPSARSDSCADCADLDPGTLIAGFRLGRVIGRGSRATVYEAMQLSLERRVALKVMHDRGLADRVRRLTWPEHPGAVRLFGAGDSEHGPWLAMRLVSGGTLETAHAPLDAVIAALEHAHDVGIVHGDVRASNVLVEGGRAYLSDFGLVPGATTAEDRAALARLVRDHPPPSPRRRGMVLAGAAAAAVTAAVLIGVLVSGTGSGESAPGTLAAPPGSRPVGSGLADGDVESVDCVGRPPGGGSRPCTVSQLELAGREVVVPTPGTITSWAVRGARGSLSLQVLRGRDGRFIVVDESAEVSDPGPGLHVERSSLAVAAGDRVALELAPGAAVGIRRRGARTSTERWFSPLRGFPPPRPPERSPGTGFDHELLLRVHVSPHTDVEPITPLRGARALSAPDGLRLATRDIDVAGEVRTMAVVSLGSAVALDLFDGTRRLARTPVPQADGRGRLATLDGRAGIARVRWINTGGARLERTFAVAPEGISPADRAG